MAQMQRMIGAVACIMIIVLDIVAGILGIEAEIAQNKGKHLRVLFFECKEPVLQAYKLGLAAALLLALAHAITGLIGGCICICSKEEFYRSPPSKQMASATLLLSWIVLVVGFFLLIIGALANSKSRTSCGFGHRNFLVIGGILCFVHALLSVGYCVSATAMQLEEGGRMRRDVGTGTPTGGPRWVQT